MMGFMYKRGLGCIINHVKSYKYLKLSVDKNNPMAFYNMAHTYRKGLFVQKDKKIAIEYYEKSSKLGCCYAMNNLDKNNHVNESTYWYKKSGKLGFLLAYSNIAYYIRKI